MRSIISILVALILLGFYSLWADIRYVSGDVWGTWSEDSVIVTDEVRVPPDSNLTIIPGVKVLFWNYCKFIVDNNATLRAVGTEQDTILFDEYFSGNRWKGIRFLNASDSSRLEYCHLTNGRASGGGEDDKGGGIYCNNSSPTIEKCYIDSCSADSEAGGGGIICIYNSSPLINNCTFIGNYAGYGGGINCNESSNPVISNNNINGNWVNYDGGGIRCHNNSSPNILGNNIRGNWTENTTYGTGGGIHCYNSNPDIINNIINDNVARENGAGIACEANSNPTIDSCTINGNSANDEGGGIYCDDSGPFITNCTIYGNRAIEYTGGGVCCFNNSHALLSGDTISGNFADDCGGGIYSGYSNPSILNCVIIEDSAFTGGGIFLANSNADINNCTISDNFTYGHGGGITCFENSDATIFNCIIDGNVANGSSGGIRVYNSDPTLELNIISENTAENAAGIDFLINSNPAIISNRIINNNAINNAGGICCGSNPQVFKLNEISGNTANSGGGIYFWDNCVVLMNKNTIVDNNASQGGGIYCDSSTDTLINCILWGNVPDQIYQTGGSYTKATYCDIQQVWPDTGNINIDPLFVDPQNGDYHLSWNNFPVRDSTMSPCIDSGCPEPQYNDPNGSRADMGCYYYDYTVSCQNKERHIPLQFSLHTPYPNPFNCRATISYTLERDGFVELAVYDAAGREVARLAQGRRSAGFHSVEFDGEGLVSGLYFVSLRAERMKSVRKLILLK